MSTRCNALALALLLPSLPAPDYASGARVDDRSYELFSCAIQNHSTSPNYVLITVTDARSAKTRQFVTTANLLAGAIHREFDIPYTNDGERRADKITLSAHDRHFTFKKRAALDNIEPRYTPDVLAEVRERVASLTDAEIRAGFSFPARDYSQAIRRVCIGSSASASWVACRDALGHALLERGIPCGIADVSGQLYVDQKSCPAVAR